jgi:hypothetical protein
MPAESEQQLTVSQICARLPGARGAKRVSPSTVCRWIIAGCPARDGSRVRLAATRAGSRWLVFLRDLDEFFLRLAEDPAAPTPNSPARTPAQRGRRGEAAERHLIERGA